ncbi:MAG: sulfite exporter TauE/SafE family protein [Methyloligellaceae bacterium]
MSFLVIMLAGFAGSFHCVGMCGGLVCGLGRAPSGSPLATSARHLLYNSGRVVTYAFIGALAGLFGAALIGHETGMVLAGDVGTAQRVLSVVAGLLMLVMALQLFGLLRHLPGSWAAIGGTAFASALQALLRSPSPAAPVALGVANGFLPCPLVLAFAASAAATGAVAPAVLTMVAFGLGTFPAMFAMGALGRVLAPSARRWGVRVAGAFVLVIGLITLVRGVLPGLLHGGHAMHMALS